MLHLLGDITAYLEKFGWPLLPVVLLVAYGRVRGFILEAVIHGAVMTAGLALIVYGSTFNLFPSHKWTLWGTAVAPYFGTNDTGRDDLVAKDTLTFWLLILVLLVFYATLPEAAFRSMRLYVRGKKGVAFAARVLNIALQLPRVLNAVLWLPMFGGATLLVLATLYDWLLVRDASPPHSWPAMFTGCGLIAVLVLIERRLKRRDRGLVAHVPPEQPTLLSRVKDAVV